jgi:hypothetical protein
MARDFLISAWISVLASFGCDFMGSKLAKHFGENMGAIQIYSENYGEHMERIAPAACHRELQSS